MNCFFCQSPKKYKCSSCKIPYCSVTCYKQHKDKCEGPVHRSEPINTLFVEQQSIIKTDYLSDQSLRVPLAKLALLAKDPKMIELLKNEELRNRLLSIDNSKQRITQTQQSMQNDEFYNFFRRTMELLEMNNEQQ